MMHSWIHHRARAKVALAVAAASSCMLISGGGNAQAASQAWKLEPSASVTLPGGQILAVSCSSAKACTAVGSNRDTAGINVTLAERWNGRTWHRQHTPNPAQGTVPAVSPVLASVSCPVRDFCEAVGSYQLGPVSVSIAESWNGHVWKWQPFPIPVGSFGSGLDGVSCTSARFCVAVGSYTGGVGGTFTLAAAWNGKAWHLRHSANPANVQSVKLNAVSCVSATLCEAGGGSDSSSTAFAEVWHGRSWRLQAVPQPSGFSGGINSVSCVSATFCEAVGPASAYMWNGVAWQTQPIANGIMSAVSCSSAKFCEAVGAANINGNVIGIAAVWHGLKWRAQSTPNPAGATYTHLLGVSCTAAFSCKATGFSELQVTASDPQALVESWGGRSWRLQDAVAPAAATPNYPHAVSCVSTSFCEAVGAYVGADGNERGLAEEWNGTRWAVQAVPSATSPYAPTTQSLFGVSCVSASFCEAVGVGSNGPDAEMWNGTSWQLQTRPNGGVQPETVSCSAADFCMAAGGSQVSIWNGSSWSAGASVPGFSVVESLSCLSASFCEAVGGGPVGQNAAVWNGSTWSGQPTAGPVSVVLNGVSCISATSCEAVGAIYGGQAGPVTLAESWNGSTWTIQATPNPAVTQGSVLNAVSCTSATSCTAVGQNQYNFLYETHTLAETWNGTSWNLRASPNVPNTGQDTLNTVSCPATRQCVAVGQTQDVGLIPAGLIESGD